MAPEQLLFFALFLLLALFNLFARWLRRRMGSRAPGDVTEPQAPPREERTYEVREIPPPQEVPPAREAPPAREMPPVREMPPARERLRRRERAAQWQPRPLPPGAREREQPLPPEERVRERTTVSLEDRLRERARVPMEEISALTRPLLPPAPAAPAPKRRARVRLDDRRELRRAILLREILGPPRSLERPERDV